MNILIILIFHSFIQVFVISDERKAIDVKIFNKIKDVCVGQIAAKQCSQGQTWRTNDIPILTMKRPGDTGPFPENSIFFIDTSCDGNLSLSQACTVSAVALLNPDYSVNVLLIGNVNRKFLNRSYLGETVHLFSNVFLYKINLNTYFENTPLENVMVQVRDCLVQVYPEVLSYVTLNLFGGIYVDWNVFVTKPFELLPQATNFIAKVDMNTLGTGIFSFSKRGKLGPKISEALLRKYMDAFMNGDWEINGTEVITEVFHEVCGRDVRKMTVTACKDGFENFEIYNPNYFYPIRRENSKTLYLFTQEQISDEAFAYYIWDSNSIEPPIFKETLFGQLIESYCPYNRKIQSELKTLFKTSDT